MDGVQSSRTEGQTLRANHGQTSRPNPKGTPRAPVSLEGERRKAMHLIFTMEKDLTLFREKWLFDANDENTDDWVNFVNQLRNRRGPNTAFNSMSEFEEQLQKIRKEQEEQGSVASKSLTIVTLQQICDRERSFEKLYELSYRKIDNSLNHHVMKYCLSFCTELENLDVECVRQYENNINTWQAEIRSCLEDADRAKEKIDTVLANSFLDYISSYGDMLQCMDVVLNAFSGVCDPFRSWVTTDEGYAKKISTEIKKLISRRTYITDVLRKNIGRLHDTKAKELRASFQEKKLDEQVQGVVSNRNFCRKREFSCLNKIAMTESMLQEKRLKLQNAVSKLHSQPMLSLGTELSGEISDKMVRLQREVAQLESKLEKMKQDKRDLRETRYSMQKEYYTLKDAYEMNLNKAPEGVKMYKGHIQNIKGITQELKTVDRKIAVLKRIYEVKTHPETVKKIFFEGYVPGQKLDFRDTLQDAISVAASGVGKDWGRMYQHLPFNPTRYHFIRQKDLESMDMDFRSVHPSCEQMALRSLDKWKVLSNVTSVNALVRTLRTIKKIKVADKIEKQVLAAIN